MELVLLGDDVEQARAVAGHQGAQVYVDSRDVDGLPFRTMTRVSTAGVEDFVGVGTLGVHSVYVRTEKEPVEPASEWPTPSLVTINALVRRADLTHADADRRWERSHAPLVRRHHVGVARYEQLSVVRTVSGTPYDGFALCFFDDEADFRERFYDGPAGRRAVLDDIRGFADLTASPRRLVAVPVPARVGGA